MSAILLLAAALQTVTPAGSAETAGQEKAKVRTASASVTRTSSDPGESAAAREQARRCEEELDRESAILACREALRLGLREPRRGALRQLLELRLAEAERFDELVQAYREDAAELPADAARLGEARVRAPVLRARIRRAPARPSRKRAGFAPRIRRS